MATAAASAETRSAGLKSLIGARNSSRRYFLRDPRVAFALPVLTLIVLIGIFGERIAPYDPNRQSLLDNLQPPSLESSRPDQPPHLAGTDHLGRDVFSRVIAGARISISIGLGTALLAFAIGVTVGVLAGYYGGPLSLILMRVVDIQLAFPFMVLAITVIAAAKSSITAVVLTLAFWGWVPFARLARAEVLVQREREYVAAARIIGASSGRIIGLYLLPNIASSLLVALTFFVGVVILSEGALSFLGFGVQPPDPSWGQMMAEGRSRLGTAWWITLAPGIPLSLSVLSVNLLGDALTDALNPRVQRR
jgi:peptide/nickel transport system permease protein